MTSNNLNVINGLQDPTPLDQQSGLTTNSVKIQEVIYELSKTIFDYSSEDAQLSDAVNFWADGGVTNKVGVVPAVVPVDTRVGAATNLLGYLTDSKLDGLVSLILNAGSLKSMQPILTVYLDHFKKNKLAFQVSNVDYDFVNNELVDATPLISDVARTLNIPLVSSTVGLENDGFHTAFLNSVIANSLGLSFHSYDGIRAAKQATKNAGSPGLTSANATNLPKISNILEAFEATNKVLGTNLAPFEYYGAKEPSVVYVTLGLPGVLARAQPDFVGVVNIRLYSPFLADQFLKVLPTSAANIVVVSHNEDLFKDVSAALKFHYGFKHGPNVEREILEVSEDAQPFDKAETGPTIKFWDSDKAVTTNAAGLLAKNIESANVFNRFDNLTTGGIINADLRFDFSGKQFWDLKNADAAVVNSTGLLKFVDVTATIKPQGKLVVAAATDDDVDKIIPTPLKVRVAAKGLEVYRVDYAKVASKGSDPRISIVANHAIFWLLAGTESDAVAVKVVESAGGEAALAGLNVGEIVTALLDGAYARVSTEIVEKEWVSVEITGKDTELELYAKAKLNSFLPADNSNLEEGDEENAAPGTNVDELTSLDLKKRLIFNNPYSEHLELRPEVPAKTFVAKVKQNTRVTPADYDRHIFELEFDISGTGLKYEIGESLGVHAPNNSEQVLQFLQSYGIDPEEVVGLPLNTAAGEDGSKQYRTAFQVFKNYLDLFGKVPKRFYESLSHFAADEAQKTKLQQLSTAAGAEELKKRTEEDFENYVDVLNEFNSAKPTLKELVDLIAPLKRREYSIASSQRVHPNEVHLLIVVVDWVTAKGEKRYGQCSKYLSELHDGAEVVVSVKPSVTKLPKDSETPIIMAGLGTGLAPFKAFLEEKMWQRDNGHKVGPVYLFLGSRHRRQEYLYGDLFEAYKAAGILTHIGAAFSRDQPEKIYIQHRIKQAKEELVDAFVHKKGNFYLCGPTWPVPDISEALTDIVVTGSSVTGEKVNIATLIEDLKEAERYILEVY